jgi:hypothetical protein
MIVGALHFSRMVRAGTMAPWSTTTAWITLTAGPKHAATIFMISHLCYELHQGGWSGSGALLQTLSRLSGVLSVED